MLSTPKAIANNCAVLFKERYAKIIEPNGSTPVQVVHQGDWHCIHPSIERAVIAQVSDFVKWLLKLGHINESDLKILKSKYIVTNFNLNDNESFKDCKICIQDKETVWPFPKESNCQSDDLLNLNHSGLCGLKRVPSHAGSWYFITFINDKSRYIEVSFLKTKDETKNAFNKYKAAVANCLGKKLKILRSDNSLEYCSK